MNERIKQFQRTGRVLSSIPAILALLLLLSSTPAALGSSPNEMDVKAAFILNFLKFVTWAPGERPVDGSPIIIGALEDNGLYESLSKMVHKKTVGGRQMITGRLDPDKPDFSGYHLVFIGCDNPDNIRKALKKVKGKAVLTVGDQPGFAHSGGVIGFIRKDQKIRFEINVRAAREIGVEFSSRLLGLAVVIDE